MRDSNIKVQPLGGAAGYSGASVISTHKVLRNTYLLLSMTLLFSAVTAGLAMALKAPPLPWWASLIGMMGLLFLVNRTQNSAAGIASVFAFTGFVGFVLGPMLSFYLALPGGGSIVMTALGGTAAIFLGLSAYVLTTKRDFSFMGGFLMAGLIAVFVASIANIFFQVAALHVILAGAGMLIGAGLILFDTSRIINGGETNYISATVSLYLDIYYVFVNLLQLTGLMSGDD